MPRSGIQLNELLAAEADMSEIEIHKDEVADKLDEMADLCEYWKRNRDNGRTPGAIRAALLMLAGEVFLIGRISAMDECNRQRSS